jgi:hypothetical protein
MSAQLKSFLPSWTLLITSCDYGCLRPSFKCHQDRHPSLQPSLPYSFSAFRSSPFSTPNCESIETGLPSGSVRAPPILCPKTLRFSCGTKTGSTVRSGFRSSLLEAHSCQASHHCLRYGFPLSWSACVTASIPIGTAWSVLLLPWVEQAWSAP